jgi:hypothetical protein
MASILVHSALPTHPQVFPVLTATQESGAHDSED